MLNVGVARSLSHCSQSTRARLHTHTYTLTLRYTYTKTYILSAYTLIVCAPLSVHNLSSDVHAKNDDNDKDVYIKPLVRLHLNYETTIKSSHSLFIELLRMCVLSFVSFERHLPPHKYIVMIIVIIQRNILHRTHHAFFIIAY